MGGLLQENEEEHYSRSKRRILKTPIRSALRDEKRGKSYRTLYLRRHLKNSASLLANPTASNGLQQPQCDYALTPN
jgi:hypothetical protein